jgi:hypothetical protein
VWMTTNETNSNTDFILLFFDLVSLSLFQLLYNKYRLFRVLVMHNYITKFFILLLLFV